MFHGTSWDAAKKIAQHGFRPSSGGCLGPGVYAGPVELALQFALKQCGGGMTGAIVAVRFTAARPAYVEGDNTAWQAAGLRHDACCAAQTSCSPSMEWCIRDPARVTVLGIERVDVGAMVPSTAAQRDRFLNSVSAKFGGSSGADGEIFRCLREQDARATVRWQHRLEESRQKCALLEMALDSSRERERAAERALALTRRQLDLKRSQLESLRCPITEELTDIVCCPIAHEVMQDPVILSDGHTYERAPIQAWLERCAQQNSEPTSPLTNAVLDQTTMTPNIAVRILATRVRAYTNRDAGALSDDHRSA